MNRCFVAQVANLPSRRLPIGMASKLRASSLTKNVSVLTIDTEAVVLEECRGHEGVRDD